MSLEVPDKNGKLTNVVVGLDSLQDYINMSRNKVSKYLGASIGRYAGRISNGKIRVNDHNYILYNEKGVHLHGGKNGFDERVWEVDYIDEDELSISLSYFSEHLEEGYPGNLRVKVIYQLTNDNELKITYQAISDQDTVVNLTNHAYYNLNGNNTITDHVLQLHCSRYLEVDAKQLPTGVDKSIVDTKFDFCIPKKLNVLKTKGSIDDTLIFDPEKDPKIIISAEESGITMKVHTNQPSVVMYTPEEFPDWNFRKGTFYHKFPAVCFETQNYPDAPNHNNFPSAFIKAGELYENRSVFSFSKKDI
ncbi:galactose mutarotase [Aquimarina mytili]